MVDEPGWAVPIQDVSDLRRGVVVVPAHDERERLPVCLASIMLDSPLAQAFQYEFCDLLSHCVPSAIGWSKNVLGVL